MLFVKPDKAFDWNINKVSRRKNDDKHYFCGKNYYHIDYAIFGGFPLILVADFFAKDPMLKLLKYPFTRLPLFFCWESDFVNCEFIYKISNDNIIVLKSALAKQSEMIFPYNRYPKFFPLGEIELSPTAEKNILLIKRLNSGEIDIADLAEMGLDLSWAFPRHQTGGIPLLLDELNSPKCYECHCDMPLFSVVSNSNLSKKGFADCRGVQMLFFICDSCSIVHVLNMVN